MRRTTALLALLLATACSTTSSPAYTVANETRAETSGSADLILPGATEGQARAAIRDYAASLNGPHLQLYYLKVMRTEDASTYVCRARWYSDEHAYAGHSDRTEQPTSWPHLAVTCP
ncbi:hypothetical protein [Streptomyces sp. NPDC000880]